MNNKILIVAEYISDRIGEYEYKLVAADEFKEALSKCLEYREGSGTSYLSTCEEEAVASLLEVSVLNAHCWHKEVPADIRRDEIRALIRGR